MRSVTLLEDRAHVARRGRVTLSRGTARLVVEGVSPLVCDRSLRPVVRLAAAAAGPPLGGVDSRVRREHRPWHDGRPVDEAGLVRRLDEARHRVAQAEAEAAVARRRLEAVAVVQDLSVRDAAAEAAHGRADARNWRQRQSALADQECKLRRSLGELEFAARRLRREAADVERRVESTRTPARRWTASVHVLVDVPAAGEYEFSLEYTVGAACWRPHHTARLATSPKPQVTFESDACVWQNTGEDWVDVEMSFSTQRPSLGAEPPQLASDVLSVRKKPSGVVVETRSQEIHTAGRGAAAPRLMTELPGIDDGGEVLAFRAKTAATVPSDGRPYRVAILRFASDAECELVCAPEIAPCAVLKTVHDNASPYPVLAGPVDLVKNAGLSGRAVTGFVAPGERFALGWGPDGAVYVHRDHSQHDDEKKALSSWVSRHHHVSIFLSNLGPVEKALHVSERLPVSELEQVQVDCDHERTTGGKTPDAQGLLHWTAVLPAFSHERIDLFYMVRRHKDVVGA